MRGWEGKEVGASEDEMIYSFMCKHRKLQFSKLNKDPPLLHTFPCLYQVIAKFLWINRRGSSGTFTFRTHTYTHTTLLYSVAWASHLGKALSYFLEMLEFFRIQIENTHLALPSIFLAETLGSRLVKGLT